MILLGNDNGKEAKGYAIYVKQWDEERVKGNIWKNNPTKKKKKLLVTRDRNVQKRV